MQRKPTTRSGWVLWSLLGLELAGPLAAVEQGDVAPPWRARDFAGQSIDFPAVTRGKPAVVVFWATWCSYCKAFMPYLKNIQNDYAAHDVKIVAINAKEDGNVIHALTSGVSVSRPSPSPMVTTSRRLMESSTFRAC